MAVTKCCACLCRSSKVCYHCWLMKKHFGCRFINIQLIEEFCCCGLKSRCFIYRLMTRWELPGWIWCFLSSSPASSWPSTLSTGSPSSTSILTESLLMDTVFSVYNFFSSLSNQLKQSHCLLHLLPSPSSHSLLGLFPLHQLRQSYCLLHLLPLSR